MQCATAFTQRNSCITALMITNKEYRIPSPRLVKLTKRECTLSQSARSLLSKRPGVDVESADRGAPGGALVVVFTLSKHCV